MVEVDTGIEAIKIGYSSEILENNHTNVLSLNMALKDLVVKAKSLRRYDSSKKERIYEIVCENGSIFTTYKGVDLRAFTLGQLLEMMNFPLYGEVLKICGGFKDVIVIEDDEFDNLSL